MKNFSQTLLLLSAFFMFSSGVGFAQQDSIATAAAEAVVDTSYWSGSAKFGLNFNQAAFSDNWKGGGVNSIAFSSYLFAKLNYAKAKISWDNTLDLSYGVIKNDGQGLRKSIDKILFDSKLGYKLTEKIYSYASLNFLTQFYHGYKYGKDAKGVETADLISTFMSPAFLKFSLGVEYRPTSYFWVGLSPFSPRFTFVTDTTIYHNVPKNYGVEIGKTYRMEWLAANVTANFDKDIAKNLNLKARYDMYVNFEQYAWDRIDHRLDVMLTAKINKLIDVNFRTIFLYDKDQDDKLQISQTLAIGLAYTIRSKYAPRK